MIFKSLQKFRKKPPFFSHIYYILRWINKRKNNVITNTINRGSDGMKEAESHWIIGQVWTESLLICATRVLGSPEYS